MRKLIILRPEPGATSTAAAAAKLGLAAGSHPLFAAEAVAWSPPPGPFDALLLTSANAVRLAGRLPRLPAYGVGEATAAAARAAGLEVLAVGSDGVDDLLRGLPADLDLLHLAGEERLLPASPRQRITSVTVYRMVPLAPPDPKLLEEAVVLVHSPAAGRRLAEVTSDRSRVRVAAISPAAARACGNGWTACEASAQPNDAALLFLAAKLCKEQGR